jgi:hypothetical protein
VTNIRLHRQSDEERPSQSDLVAFQSPKARAMLVMAGVVSLGLWAAIWLAVTSLASAWSSFRWGKVLAMAVIAVAISVTDGCKFDGIDRYSRQIPVQGAAATSVAATIGSALDESVTPRPVALGFGRDPLVTQVQMHVTPDCRRAGVSPRRTDIGTDGEEKWHAKSA